MTTSDPSPRPSALITGASAGIGAAFAERLARDGYDLILVARRRERLEAMAARLQAQHGITVDILAADLGDPLDLRYVEAHIAAEPRLSILVNNAGFGNYMPFVDLDPDAAEEQIDVQIVAVTRLTRAALPGMLQRGRGVIINVSSRLAFSASAFGPFIPKRATYAATKAYVNTFSQILASELEGTGVHVQALCPGVVRTEFHARQGLDPDRFPPAAVMTPEDVVTASLTGLQLGEVICIPSLEDASLIDQLHVAERALLPGAGAGSLASRYHG